MADHEVKEEEPQADHKKGKGKKRKKEIPYLNVSNPMYYFYLIFLLV